MADRREFEDFEPLTEAQDEELRRKVRASFDNVHMDDERKASMLANLKVAAKVQDVQTLYDARDGQDSRSKDVAKRKPDENKVPYDISRNRPSTRTRMIPHIAAGVAIVLVLGVVVVNSGVFSPHSNSASSDAAYEAVEEEAVNTGTMEAASMEGAAEENAQADAEAVVVDWAAEYPVVELPDGTRLRLGEETTVSNLGWFEATTAYSEDGSASVKCRVRDNGDGTYIVTYDYRQFYEAVPE